MLGRIPPCKLDRSLRHTEAYVMCHVVNIILYQDSISTIGSTLGCPPAQ